MEWKKTIQDKWAQAKIVKTQAALIHSLKKCPECWPRIHKFVIDHLKEGKQIIPDKVNECLGSELCGLCKTAVDKATEETTKNVTKMMELRT